MTNCEFCNDEMETENTIRLANRVFGCCPSCEGGHRRFYIELRTKDGAGITIEVPANVVADKDALKSLLSGVAGVDVSPAGRPG